DLVFDGAPQRFVARHEDRDAPTEAHLRGMRVMPGGGELSRVEAGGGPKRGRGERERDGGSRTHTPSSMIKIWILQNANTCYGRRPIVRATKSVFPCVAECDPASTR